MVLWIGVAVVVVALIVLGILAFDVLGHLRRLQKAIYVAQHDTAPYVVAVMSLAQVRGHRDDEPDTDDTSTERVDSPTSAAR